MCETSGSHISNGSSGGSSSSSSDVNLRWWTKLGYGMGHVLNDLCAAMWFSYLLVYFHMVLNFDNKLSGLVLLVGQVADGLATPLVGMEVDREGSCFCIPYGRRKTWHAIGTVCVLGSFAFIFMPCVGCRNSHEWAQLLYYLSFVVLFQVGWATVQISHLSLIPYLSHNPHDRTELTAFRYGFTVLASIMVYVTAWLVMGLSQDKAGSSHVGPEDQKQFTEIVIVVVSVGTFASFLFHLLVSERRDGDFHLLSTGEEKSSNGMMMMRIRDWLREPRFYQVALLYMATRLYVNLSQVYLPLYLQDTLHLPQVSIAILPLVMFTSGFVSSFLMKWLNRRLGRKVAYVIGALICVGSSLSMYFGEGRKYEKYGIYASAVGMGTGASTILITSLGITADLIGPSVGSGAFVYGAMSFTDKLANGLVVMLLQALQPCTTHICCSLCITYYRQVMGLVCGAMGVLGLVALISLAPCSISVHRRELLEVNGSSGLLHNDISSDGGSYSSDDLGIYDPRIQSNYRSELVT